MIPGGTGAQSRKQTTPTPTRKAEAEVKNTTILSHPSGLK